VNKIEQVEMAIVRSRSASAASRVLSLLERARDMMFSVRDLNDYATGQHLQTMMVSIETARAEAGQIVHRLRNGGGH
jgi:hypothetical protein